MKHVRLTKHQPLVSKAEQVVVRAVGFGLGGYSGGPQIIVELDAGDFAYIEAVVNTALAFLEAGMDREGISFRA